MRSIINTIRNVGIPGMVVLNAAIAVTGVTACGSDRSQEATTGVEAGEGTAQRPLIVVTTNILGDVVGAAIGDSADVEVIMPLGSDPHDFAPSARQAESMENADLLVVNGAGFEEGMLDIIANIADSGTPVMSFAEQIDLLAFTYEDDERADEEDVHDGEGKDPHFWTDPSRIATAVEALEPVVAGLDGVDADVLATSVDKYLGELGSLEASIEETLATVPDDQRVLVTNHEVFGYFAVRFDFEVVGAIVPSLTTNAEPSAADIEELATLIETEGVAAIFGETTQSSQLAEALAEEVGGDVEIVELFSESLGDEGSGAVTYIEMMQRNADLIAGALST
jgi:zinc/manganese transport system substrate-binding protein